ncbi:MAG: hypothetical protein Fur002_25560 [Anaerolineales bacterium]
MSDKNNELMSAAPQVGLVRGILNNLKLIGRLMADRRVNIFAKLIPIGTLIYLVSPVDAIMLPVIGVVDDAALLWLSSYAFTEFCPPDVVEEHMNAILGVNKTTAQSDVVDGEVTDVEEK